MKINGLEVKIMILAGDEDITSVIIVLKETIRQYFLLFNTLIPNGNHIVVQGYEPFVIMCHEIDIWNQTLTFIIE